MAILAEAAALATVYGLEGLTIGRLAELTGMSKGGLFAHFGSKENLQSAIVSTAAKCSYNEFTKPAMEAGSPLERLWEQCDQFLYFVERGVFPGGCFFSAVAGEMKILPKRVRRRIERYQKGRVKLLVKIASEAIQTGELNTILTPEQIAFELNGLTVYGNLIYVAHNDPAALDKAWESVCRLLGDPDRPRRKVSD